MKEKPKVVSASLAQKIIPLNYFNVLNETLYSHLPVKDEEDITLRIFLYKRLTFEIFSNGCCQATLTWGQYIYKWFLRQG